MFVVHLMYQKPLEEITPHIPAHREFLDRYYERGLFLLSGPKTPRDGGIIIVSGHVSRQRLEALLQEDAFHRHALARYEISEFTPSKYAPALRALL